VGLEAVLQFEITVAGLAVVKMTSLGTGFSAIREPSPWESMDSGAPIAMFSLERDRLMFRPELGTSRPEILPLALVGCLIEFSSYGQNKNYNYRKLIKIHQTFNFSKNIPSKIMQL